MAESDSLVVQSDQPEPSPVPARAPAPPPARPPDRWAHRRGEPRVLALLWAVYLFATVAGGLLWVTRLGSLSPSAYGPAARIMLVMMVVGVTILWPMTRLSQARPGAQRVRRPITDACLLDLLIVLGPILVIVWPLAALAGWAYGVIAALAAMFVAWATVSGGLVSLALALEARFMPGAPPRRFAGLWRSFWTAACVVASTGAMVGPWIAGRVSGVAPGSGQPSVGWLEAASPYSFIFLAAGQGLSGPSSPVPAEGWYAIAATGLIGAAVWGMAGWIEPSGLRGKSRLD